MNLTFDDYAELLRSPRSGLPLTRMGSFLVTADATERYPIVNGLPLLIDHERSIVPESAVRDQVASRVDRPERRGVRKVVKRLLSPAKRETVQNIRQFVAALKKQTPSPLVLVIGGGTEGQGTDELYADRDIRLLSFDIYSSTRTNFVADAHQIPLADQSVDGVLIQAVLEHVLEPHRVVAEIWRVLKDDALVYAETPFLQQVHEGAFDFTRFTDSGHRHLFRHFAVVASGPAGGSGTQLLWAIDYFFRGLFRSRAVGKAFKLAFFWLSYFDHVIPREYTIDNASGFFLLGRKTQHVASPREIVAYYAGADGKRRSIRPLAVAALAAGSDRGRARPATRSATGFTEDEQAPTAADQEAHA